MTYPTLAEEVSFWKQGYTVIGVDEVGRGCLAGPLYVCAAYFEPAYNPETITYLESLGINDSKKLTPLKRQKLYQTLQDEKFHFSIGTADATMIDQKGLTYAVQHAATQALTKLLTTLDTSRTVVLFDGSLHHDPDVLTLEHTKVIPHGDSLSLSIASASIMAKVTRDAHMDTLALQFPHYNWSSNKGYGTVEHIAALKIHGKTDHHRQLFLRKIMQTK